MIMKIHSYVSVNGYLQSVSRRSKEVLAELKCATASVGGWEQASREATLKKAEIEAQTDDVPTPMDMSTPNTDGMLLKSFTDPQTASALRQRLVAVSKGSDGSAETARKALNEGEHGCEEVEEASVVNVLAFHPNALVAGLAKEFLDLDSELVSTGPEHVRWPQNVTLRNFVVYQLIPTLVYELEYPRTDR